MLVTPPVAVTCLFSLRTTLVPLRINSVACGGGVLYVDTLKKNQARTVPLVAALVPIVDRWSAGKEPGA